MILSPKLIVTGAFAALVILAIAGALTPDAARGFLSGFGLMIVGLAIALASLRAPGLPQQLRIGGLCVGAAVVMTGAISAA